MFEYLQIIANKILAPFEKPKVKLSRLIFVFSAIVILIIRFSVDIFIYVINLQNNAVKYTWQTFSGFAIAFFIFIYLYTKLSKVNKSIVDRTLLYLEELKQIVIALGLSLLLVQLVPDKTIIATTSTKPSDFYSIFIIDIIGAIVNISFLLILFSLVKWFQTFRHKKTRKLINWGAVLLLISIILNKIELFANLKIFANNKLWLETIPNVIHSSLIILTILLIIVTYLLAGKNEWITKLNRPKKWKLIGYSVLVIIFTTIIITKLNDNLSNFYKLIFAFAPLSIHFIELLSILLITYFLRVIWKCILSLPTSEYLERKTNELSNLLEINKLITQAITKDKLIEQIAILTLQSSNGNTVWVETYENVTNPQISFSLFLKNETINNLQNFKTLSLKFSNLYYPVLYESIPDDLELNVLDRLQDQFKCMMAVPLFSGTERFGVLVVTHQDEYGFEEDDLNILGAFANNFNIALENSRLLKDSIENERYKRELALAQEMQQRLLPQVLPEFKNLTVEAFSKPAEEVGGDYYDIVYLKNGLPCFLIGDVSGKGISAAFFMTQVKGAALALSPNCSSGKELLERINRTLFKTKDKKTYITLSTLTINEEKNEFYFVRAGHMPCYFKKDKEIIKYIPKGLGIGLASHELFSKNLEEITIDYNNYSSMILFTDGLNELKNENNEEFGYDSVSSFLENDFTNAKELKDFILEKANLFQGTSEQHDDITFIALVSQNNK